MVAGLQVACEAHIQGGKYWGNPPVKIGNLDHLILIIYPVLQVACEAQILGHPPEMFLGF